MIKAQELRIGNYLEWNNNSKVIIQVSEIHEYTIKEYLEDSLKFEIRLVDLEPIPITEDWLLNFGFEKNTKQTDYNSIYELNNINIPKSGYFEFALGFIENEINIFLYSGDCLKHIKYIHQLQNLYFALTGEELKLKNNDI